MHYKLEEETRAYPQPELLSSMLEQVRAAYLAGMKDRVTKINKAFSFVTSNNSPKFAQEDGTEPRFTVEYPAKSTIIRENNLSEIPLHIRFVEEHRCAPGLLRNNPHWIKLDRLAAHQGEIAELFRSTISDRRAALRAKEEGKDSGRTSPTTL